MTSLDDYYMLTLILSRRTIWGESYFDIDDIMYYYGLKQKRSAEAKIGSLNTLAKLNLIEYHRHKDKIIVISIADSLTNVTGLFNICNWEVLQTIITTSTKSKKPYLFAVYSYLNGRANKKTKIAYPTIETIVSDIYYITKATTLLAIKELTDMKLILYKNLGYDQQEKKNRNNVYVINNYDQAAIELDKYITVNSELDICDNITKANKLRSLKQKINNCKNKAEKEILIKQYNAIKENKK